MRDLTTFHEFLLTPLPEIVGLALLRQLSRFSTRDLTTFYEFLLTPLPENVGLYPVQCCLSAWFWGCGCYNNYVGQCGGGCAQRVAPGFSHVCETFVLFCWQLLQATRCVLRILDCFREGHHGCAVVAYCKYWLEI